MDITKLCMGCMEEKNQETVCPSCGYDEREPISPLVLTPRTRLNSDTYLIGRVLGKPGGFGITYLGFDLKLQTTVAIKEFLPRDLAGRSTDRSSVIPHHSDDKEMFEFGLQQFLQEARTLAKFNHPNIVRVRSFFEEKGTAYLVMDYYEGVSLAEYIKSQGGKIKEKLAVDIMMPVLDGLRAVHDKGFLHRDIKPQNIYLTEGGIPILLDFGAARFAMGERSRSLSVVLTPGFAPFEQYQRKGKQGVWTDIYSCAATLYFMITGEEPPEASDRVTHDELLPPGKIVKGISPEMNHALMKSLSMEVSNRSKTIREFQDMLLVEKKPEPLPPEPEPIMPPIPQQAIPLRKGNQTFFFGVVIVVLLGIILFLVLNKGGSKEPGLMERSQNISQIRETDEFTKKSVKKVEGKYSDARIVIEDFTNATEKFINDLNKVENADDVVAALNDYADVFKKLKPKIKGLEKKYPELKNMKDLPEELKDLSDKMKELTGKMLGAMGKMLKYAEDPRVIEAQKKIQKVME